MKLPRHVLERHEDGAGARFYQTPIGTLPSVTTILDATANKSSLRTWSRSVGVEHAARTGAAARARGRSFHEEMEAYFTSGRRPTEASAYFESVQLFLRRVSEVVLVEGSLWHRDGFAGTVDCVARVDGVLSVIDWKSAREKKQPSWVVDPHLQVAAYRAAVQDLYGIEVPGGYVVFALRDDAAQVLPTRMIDEQYASFLRRFEAYRSGSHSTPAQREGQR